jgi:DNA repair protein RadC
MADQELLNLILVERAKGVSDDDIKKHLLKKKWSIEDITGALARSHIQDIKHANHIGSGLY